MDKQNLLKILSITYLLFALISISFNLKAQNNNYDFLIKEIQNDSIEKAEFMFFKSARNVVISDMVNEIRKNANVINLFYDDTPDPYGFYTGKIIFNKKRITYAELKNLFDAYNIPISYRSLDIPDEYLKEQLIYQENIQRNSILNH